MVNSEPTNPKLKLDKIDRNVFLFTSGVVVAGLLTSVVAWNIAGWTERRFAPGGMGLALAAVSGAVTYLMFRYGVYPLRGGRGYFIPRGNPIYKRHHPITYCCVMAFLFLSTLYMLYFSIMCFLYTAEVFI